MAWHGRIVVVELYCADDGERENGLPRVLALAATALVCCRKGNQFSLCSFLKQVALIAHQFLPPACEFSVVSFCFPLLVLNF